MSDQSIHQDCQVTGSSTAVYICHRRDPRRGDDTHTESDNTTKTQAVCAVAAGSESCRRDWNRQTHQWRLHRVLHRAGGMAGGSCHTKTTTTGTLNTLQTTSHHSSLTADWGLVLSGNKRRRRTIRTAGPDGTFSNHI